MSQADPTCFDNPQIHRELHISAIPSCPNHQLVPDVAQISHQLTPQVAKTMLSMEGRRKDLGIRLRLTQVEYGLTGSPEDFLHELFLVPDWMDAALVGQTWWMWGPQKRLR